LPVALTVIAVVFLHVTLPGKYRINPPWGVGP
jgi:hypothetical protein